MPLTQADFRTLPTDGNRFEALVAELLEAMGYTIIGKSGVGVDGGADAVIKRTFKDPLGDRDEIFVVQCKHYAHGNRAVGASHIGNWQNAMTINNATGYLLVCSSQVTQNLRDVFKRYTDDPSRPHHKALAWDVDELSRYLLQHPRVLNHYFDRPGDPLVMPPTIVALGAELFEAAYKAEEHFDRQRWPEFASIIGKCRERLLEFSTHPKHFESFYFFKRQPKFRELQATLSGQQLAFERVIESMAVDHLLSYSGELKTIDQIETALKGIDGYHEKTFELARQESNRLSTFFQNARKMVMVGCGAFPHSLMSAAVTYPHIDFTGLDYDNASLVNAHRVRDKLGLTGRIHYLTRNGDIFDYRGHDLILVANIVSSKQLVLQRILETSKKGTIIVLRNPVTFGEVFWDDARYTRLEGFEILDRFDSDSFGHYFETAVLRKEL